MNNLCKIMVQFQSFRYRRKTSCRKRKLLGSLGILAAAIPYLVADLLLPYVLSQIVG